MGPGGAVLCAGRRDGRAPHKWVETGCGDSGGPLFVRTPADADGDEAFVLVGVVSWGFGNDYDVYGRVAGHREWIEQTIHGRE